MNHDPGWSALAPLPEPVTLSSGYDRHAPTDAALGAELHRVLDGRDWAALGWPDLLRELTALGRADVPLAKLAESHVDAVRILAQAGRSPVPGALYGVWASRSQRTGLSARVDGDTLVLDGTVRFASGTGAVTHALVPVWLDADTHLLVDLDLGPTPSVAVDPDAWQTAAMEVSRSHTLTLVRHRVPASTQVGEPDFYLGRPGFFPGGVGVAACWLGGAARVADLVRGRLHGDLAPALALRLGTVRARLAAAAAVLQAAGLRLDDPAVHDHDGRAVATEARFVIAATVHDVLDEAHRIAGPAGLAYDRDLTRAVHDLRLYVLQANADADATWLGAAT